MDFTLNIYKTLLGSLQTQGFSFLTVSDYHSTVKEEGGAFMPPQCVILRHDVEARYWNALAFARIQQEMGVRGTYYFRMLPKHFDKNIVKEIANLEHEIGYHYDDFSHCKGDYEKALKRFKKNLSILREIAPVKTICMEGAPLSKWDNRLFWSARSSPFTVHYKDLGILTEPYFDLDYSQLFYLTDTGRRWDGYKVSVRDKIPLHQERWIAQGLAFRSTKEIISAAFAGTLPPRMMITVHPQRWNDALLPWAKELILQKVKNVVKRGIVWV